MVYSPTTNGEWGWKELAALVVQEHDAVGGSALFMWSGAPVWMYGGRLEVSIDEDRMDVVGEKLSRKAVRKFLWDQKLGLVSPEEANKRMIVWTKHEPDKDQTFIGLGTVVKVPKEELVCP